MRVPAGKPRRFCKRSVLAISRYEGTLRSVMTYGTLYILRSGQIAPGDGVMTAAPLDNIQRNTRIASVRSKGLRSISGSDISSSCASKITGLRRNHAAREQAGSDNSLYAW